MKPKRLFVSVLATLVLSLSTAVPAQAQQQVGAGLVNIQIQDVVVQAPIAVAANLCDVNAAILVADFRDDGDATCTATARSAASAGKSGGSNGQQAGVGLVNVQIQGVTIQIPISLAANVCDVNVAVLVADFRDDGDATCTATAESFASRGNGGG